MAIAALSVAAGFAGAAGLLGFVWPRAGGYEYGYQPATGREAPRNALSDSVERELSESVALVYSGTTLKSGVEVMASGQKLGLALVVSSDGWLVMPKPLKASAAKNWRVLLNSGARYKVSRAVSDDNAGLLFLQVSPESEQAKNNWLRPAVFSDKIVLPASLWARTSEGFGEVLAEHPAVTARTIPHLDYAFTPGYILNQTLPAGSILINVNGQVVGIVQDKERMLPASFLARAWEGVRESGQAVYYSLGVEGWFSEEEPFFIAGKAWNGFYVSRVVSGENPLARGDVILELNGELATADSWQENLLPPAVKALVLRAGQKLEISVPVVKK